MMQPGLHLQVLNDFIKVNGSSEGGSFFLGSRYSYAETVTTPFLVRAITVPARVGKYDVHKSIKAHGLDRLGSWVEVSLAEASQIHANCATSDCTHTGHAQGPGYRSCMRPLMDRHHF